jgi:hypothetical protein
MRIKRIEWFEWQCCLKVIPRRAWLKNASCKMMTLPVARVALPRGIAIVR